MKDNITTNNFTINFYNNVELGNAGHAEYLLALATANDKEEANEEELEIIQHINKQLKVVLHRLHLQISVLDKNNNYLKKEATIYSKIKKQSLLNEEDTEEYLLLINKFLFNEIGDIKFEDVAGEL